MFVGSPRGSRFTYDLVSSWGFLVQLITPMVPWSMSHLKSFKDYNSKVYLRFSRVTRSGKANKKSNRIDASQVKRTDRKVYFPSPNRSQGAVILIKSRSSGFHCM